jgi:hypothetical protein
MASKKPHDIPKQIVREAYERVKANRGAPGVKSLATLNDELEEQLRMLTERMLTEDNLAILRRLRSEPLFNRAAMFLDLALEPDAADDAIGNIAELYARRLDVNPGHAKRWLVAQVTWIVFGRAMDLFGRFMRARAGK